MLKSDWGFPEPDLRILAIYLVECVCGQNSNTGLMPLIRFWGGSAQFWSFGDTSILGIATKNIDY